MEWKEGRIIMGGEVSETDHVGLWFLLQVRRKPWEGSE